LKPLCRQRKHRIDWSELQSFLGLAQYCSRSIQSFAISASPLWNLTKAHTTWNWVTTRKNAFLATNWCRQKGMHPRSSETQGDNDMIEWHSRGWHDLTTSTEPESYRVEEKNGNAVIIENFIGQSKLSNIGHMKKFVSPESERVLLVLSSPDRLWHILGGSYIQLPSPRPTPEKSNKHPVRKRETL